jgi:EAL domain-containing protein (putative c-di-GMP-specific phosphodiesterase class I)/integral membrane sensor domain MASE1/GGDEF domain-containing protein
MNLDAISRGLSSPSGRAGPLTLLLLAAAVFLGIGLSRELSLFGDTMSLFWPPAGIGFAALWSYGWRGLGAALAGFALWLGFNHEAGLASALLGLAATGVGPIVMVAGLRSFDSLRGAHPEVAQGRRGLRFSSRWLVAFYLLQTLVAAPLAALLGTQALLLAGLAGERIDIFFGYWLVEALGGLLFGPATLAIAHTLRNRMPWFRTLDLTGLVGVALVAWLQAQLLMHGELAYSRAVLFLYFPVLAWRAMRTSSAAAGFTLVWAVVVEFGLTVWGYRNSPSAGELIDPKVLLLEQSLALFVVTGMTQLLQAVAQEREEAFERLAASANQDLETGLLNARGFLAALRAPQAKKPANVRRPAWLEGLTRMPPQRLQERTAVTIVLARYDAVRQLIGYEESQRVLQQIAVRVSRYPEIRALARIEGAQFCGLIDGPSAAAEHTLRKLHEEFEGWQWPHGHQPITLKVACMALALDRDGKQQGADETFLGLRLALEEANTQPVDGIIRAFDDSLVERRRRNLDMVEMVRSRIASRGLLLYCQPIVPAERAGSDLTRPAPNEQSIDFEILVRMADQQGRLIPPASFLPLAVSAGLMSDVDRAVIAQTFAWFAAHRYWLVRVGKCSINLSGVSLVSGGIVDFVAGELMRNQLPPEKFAFEVTESEALSDPNRAVDTLLALRSMGFRIALDDFGTGFATYDYLKRFKVDDLKIDGSFIRNILHEPLDQEIVRSVVNVARRLGLTTIAEFVSSPEIARAVAALGVDRLQGYAIAEPMSLADLFESKAGNIVLPAPQV